MPEDAGGLTPVKDGNAVMQFPGRCSFLPIFEICSKENSKPG